MDNYPPGSNTKDAPWNRKDPKMTEWEQCGNEKQPCDKCGEWKFIDENEICDDCFEPEEEEDENEY